MASNGLNRFEQIGHLADTPVATKMPSGELVCNFRVITNEFWKDEQSNEKKERAEGFSYSLFGPSAENIAKIMKKGDKIYVESSLRNDSYEKDGKMQYTVRCIVRRWLTLEGKDAGEAGDGVVDRAAA